MFTYIAVTACLGTAVLAQDRQTDGNVSFGCQDMTLPSGHVWHDAHGSQFNCSWYAEGRNCRVFGAGYRNLYTASQACCVCGGGLLPNETYAPDTAAPPTRAPPTFVPVPLQCKDRLLPGGEEWHMRWGPKYNCSWFELRPRHCEYYGRSYPGDTYTANEACCVCGGGLLPNEAYAPDTAAPPTPAPPTFVPVPLQCKDRLLPGGGEWHMEWSPKYNCSWFELTPQHCKRYGKAYPNMYTANEACCVCGGGLAANETNVPATTVPPIPAPPTFVPVPLQCKDRLLPGGEEWHMRWGPKYNCSWFELTPRHCEYYGRSYPGDMYTANEACCVCGGGNGTNTNSTSA
eukprot:TRINITY_DN938_c0_g1_i1.p1 TRINITY_DN938_c0_g1~~TRINITY_DN938_c0_g1_i1.p1  ORF type:complete len:345 (+),score=49.88 TRINITY_DN938_c0_g1_i1:162-1196(+)